MFLFHKYDLIIICSLSFFTVLHNKNSERNLLDPERQQEIRTTILQTGLMLLQTCDVPANGLGVGCSEHVLMRIEMTGKQKACCANTNPWVDAQRIVMVKARGVNNSSCRAASVQRCWRGSSRGSFCFMIRVLDILS